MWRCLVGVVRVVVVVDVVVVCIYRCECPVLVSLAHHRSVALPLHPVAPGGLVYWAM